MKSYKFFPSDKLKKYIDHYWWLETTNGDTTSRTERVLADSSVEIIFHFDNPVSRFNSNGILVQEPTKLLIGQTIKPYTILSTEKTSMLGIKFHNHTAKHFFDISISEIRDKHFDLSDFWGNNANLLYEQLCETKLLKRKIELIEKYLYKIKSQKNTINLVVENVIKEMLTQNGNICVRKVCSDNNFTTRYLEKLFLENVGLSPKLLSRVIQFQNALKLLKNNSTSLTHLGLEAGYFDQSHFIRNFRDFADCTPSQYIKEQFPMQELLLSSK
jgi:AraC-like DNA-binding protein